MSLLRSERSIYLTNYKKATYIKSTAMICASCDIEGQVQIGAETVLQPQCRVKSTRSEGVNIGERNVVEELCVLSNSNIEHGNVIQVGTVIEDSQVGSFTTIGAKCRITGGSVIGSRCVLSPGLLLDGVTIPDNTSVYRIGDTWSSRPVDISTIFPVNEAYRLALSDPESKQCLKNFHAMRS